MIRRPTALTIWLAARLTEMAREQCRRDTSELLVIGAAATWAMATSGPLMADTELRPQAETLLREAVAAWQRVNMSSLKGGRS